LELHYDSEEDQLEEDQLAVEVVKAFFFLAEVPPPKKVVLSEEVTPSDERLHGDHCENYGVALELLVRLERAIHLLKVVD
jgi:hypothetical protein